VGSRHIQGSSGAPSPKGIAILYLALGIMTAVKEANQGFAHRIDPCVLCSYEVDCKDIVDLRTPAARAAAEVGYDDIACAWTNFLAEGKRPASFMAESVALRTVMQSARRPKSKLLRPSRFALSRYTRGSPQRSRRSQ
jgi:RES domain-containing protein